MLLGLQIRGLPQYRNGQALSCTRLLLRVALYRTIFLVSLPFTSIRIDWKADLEKQCTHTRTTVL